MFSVTLRSITYRRDAIIGSQRKNIFYELQHFSLVVAMRYIITG